ncbi:WD40 repeat-like protein, partial [Rhizopogon vinicolor AM-OR11-026]
DLDSLIVPSQQKGRDWLAVFNPKVKRVLDVSLVHTLEHESVVCCVRFSADGKYLATGCNRTAQIYDTTTGIKIYVLADESAGNGDLYIRSVCFSPDGKYLATGSEDGRIRIWNIEKKRIRNIFDGHQQGVYSLDFSLDGKLLVSGSGDATVRIWDMVDGSSRVLTIHDVDPIYNDAGITSVTISPNGRLAAADSLVLPNNQLVAAGSLDATVRIWDVETGALVERLRGHRDSVYSVAFTPDGKGFVSGSLDKTLKYWDINGLVAKREELAVNGKTSDKSSPCTTNFLGHTDYVLSAAVSHDGQWVVSGSKDCGVRFWNSRTGTMQCMLQGHKNSGTKFQFLIFRFEKPFDEICHSYLRRFESRKRQ